MTRHEEGTLGDPVLAGNPVYDLDGRRCLQISFKGHLAAALGSAPSQVHSVWAPASSDSDSASPALDSHNLA